MYKLLFSLFLISSVYNCAAQQKSEQFNIPVNYLVYLPQDYGKDTAKQWPVLFFLHGSGESGADIEKVKVHGPPKLIEQGKQFPFIVISPQAPPMEGWEPQIFARLLKGIEDKYKIDKERVYLTGLSMGGFGTWNIAAKFPWLFAAIAPICGGGDSTEVMKLKHIPVWCFHGAKDNVVKPQESYRMVNALKKFNPDVKLTVYPEAGHDSWTATYNNDTLYTWLLSHKKFRFPRVKLDEKQLNEYAGGYMPNSTDTMFLVVKDGKLIVRDQPQFELIPTENNSFFIVEGDKEMEIKFVRNVKRQIQKMVVLEEKVEPFIRVK